MVGQLDLIQQIYNKTYSPTFIASMTNKIIQIYKNKKIKLKI